MVFGIDVDIHIVGVRVIGIDIYVYEAHVALLVARVVMLAVIGGNTGIALGGLGERGYCSRLDSRSRWTPRLDICL
jgi:hypothetical protein